MGSHAILSPSSASRWLNCTPSARLEAALPDTTSEAAQEGTLAHRLAELMLEKWYFAKTLDVSRYIVELCKVETDPMYNESMLEYITEYVDWVIDIYEGLKKQDKFAHIFFERKLNLTEYVPEGFGTGDIVIYANRALHLIDLKYGKGVSVSVVENKQMMLYGLGAMREFEFAYPIDNVHLYIYQPRMNNICDWEITADALVHWGTYVIKPAAIQAFNGEGAFYVGEWCGFCRAKSQCRAFAEKNLQLAKHEFAEPVLLTDDEIAAILTQAAQFKSWVNAVEEFAYEQAVNNGKHWNGFKVVAGRSNRTYGDTELVEAALMSHGLSAPEIYSFKLRGITEMEKRLGKTKFAEILGDFIEKPPGKPTLVPESDKRPELNSAKQDFL